MNAELKGEKPAKECTSPSAKTTVSLKAHSATRDRARLDSAGVWIGKENRSQEHEPREGDQTADLRQVSRLVWCVQLERDFTAAFNSKAQNHNFIFGLNHVVIY